MADFDEGLAIGLVLGRRKKAPKPAVYDDIYHDILNNTTYLYEQDIDGTYSFKCGVWQPAEGWGRLGLGGETPPVSQDVEAGIDTAGGVPKSTQLYSFRGAAYLRRVTVVFTGGEPLYAIVEPHGADIGAKTEYRAYPVPIDSANTRTVFYVSRDSLTIDSIALASPVGSAGMGPEISTHSGRPPYIFGGYYQGLPNINISYSYQSYHMTCTEGGVPEVVPEEPGSFDTVISGGYAYIIPRGSGAFADMTDDDLIAAVNTVSDAVCASVGYPYYSPIIIK